MLRSRCQNCGMQFSWDCTSGSHDKRKIWESRFLCPECMEAQAKKRAKDATARAAVAEKETATKIKIM